MKHNFLAVLTHSLLSVNATLACSLGHHDAIDLRRGLSLRHVASLEDDAVTVELEYEGHAWLSVGVSRTGRMVVSDAVIGIPEDDNSSIPPVNPGKYRMTTESSSGSGVNLLPSSYQTLRDSSISQNATHTVLRFTKFLEENDELPISRDEESVWIYAVGRGNSYPSMHSRHGAIRIPSLNPCVEVEDFTPRPPAEVLLDVSDGNLRSLWIAHGVLMAIAWGALVPISIGMALLRHVDWAKRFGIEKWWMPAHRSLHLLAAAFTLAGFAVAVVATSLNTFAREQAKHFEGAHGMFGLGVVVLLVLQVWSGYLRPPRLTTQKIIKLHDGLYKADQVSECDTTEESSSDLDYDYGDPVYIKEIQPESKQLCAMSRSQLQEIAQRHMDTQSEFAAKYLSSTSKSQMQKSAQKFMEMEDGLYPENTSLDLGSDNGADYSPTSPGTVHVASKSWYRIGWEISHRFVGVLVFAVALYNCHSGIQELAIKYGADDEWNGMFLGLTGFVCGTIFLLTYLIR